MLHHEIRIDIVIDQYLRHIQAMRDAVVEDNRHAILCQLAILLDVLAITAKAHDQTVHHKLLHHPQVLQLSVGVLVALRNHHFLVLLVEHFLDAIDDGGSVWRVHFWHDNPDSVGTSHLQVHRHWVAFVAEALCLLHHHITRFLTNVLVIGKGTRDGRDRNT